MGEQTVGNFKIEFSFIDRVTGKPMEGEYRTPLGLVGDELEERVIATPDGQAPITVREITRRCPIVSNKEPWSGELTQHELDWVSGMPGVDFNLSYRFTVTPLKS